MTWENLVESFRRPVELVRGYTQTPKNGGNTEIFLLPEALQQLADRKIIKGKIKLPKQVREKDLVVRIKHREENETLLTPNNGGILITLEPIELYELTIGNPVLWSNTTIRRQV